MMSEISMIVKLKSYFRKSSLLIVLVFIFYNFKAHVRRLFRISVSDSGMTHLRSTLDESMKYIQTVFKDYKEYGSVTRFYGKVAEVGPGDNFGVALKILSDGAREVDLLDRFYSQRDMKKQKEIYQALGASDRKIQEALQDIDLERIEEVPGINYLYGEVASANSYFKEKENVYDFIVSRSVLEHVDDPIEALEDMLKALKVGGKLIHKIDLKDHGMFTPEFCDTKYFEIPAFIYRLITRGSGYPNRILYYRYFDFIQRHPGYKSKIYLTHLAGVGEIVPHQEWKNLERKLLLQSTEWIEKNKDKFSHEIRKVESEKLCPFGMFLVMEK